MTINELVAKNHQAMKEKGFHEGEKNIGELLMLIVSELGEALDAHRKDKMFNPGNSIELNTILKRYADGIPADGEGRIFFLDYVKDTLEDELADAVLRIVDLCGQLNIDLETHIRAKMRYNATRPYKHNKAY